MAWLGIKLGQSCLCSPAEDIDVTLSDVMDSEEHQQLLTAAQTVQTHGIVSHQDSAWWSLLVKVHHTDRG